MAWTDVPLFLLLTLAWVVSADLFQWWIMLSYARWFVSASWSHSSMPLRSHFSHCLLIKLFFFSLNNQVVFWRIILIKLGFSLHYTGNKMVTQIQDILNKLWWTWPLENFKMLTLLGFFRNDFFSCFSFQIFDNEQFDEIIFYRKI